MLILIYNIDKGMVTMKIKSKYRLRCFRWMISILLFQFYTNSAFAQYPLVIQYADKDTAFVQPNGIQTDFSNSLQCLQYVSKLTALLQSKGYINASIDSFTYDSVKANLQLYVGQKQRFLQLQVSDIEKKALESSGYFAKNFNKRPLSFSQLDQLQKRLLDFYENNGYPFAAISLQNINWVKDTFNASLQVTKGILYKVDSIRLYGNAKISNYFLQRYLDIPNGSLYRKSKFESISKKIQELPYVKELQPSDITMLGSGSVLNLYLTPRKSSQLNFLVGFLPAGNESGKLRVTGDVNINLKNAFGSGETLLLNWQQLQIKSPRLNIGYQQPYIFKSAFGFDLNFDLLKKDSSFLLINALVGLQYLLSEHQTGKLFFQNQSSFLLGGGVDTNQVKINKVLPANVDFSSNSIGIDYNWNKTNYRLNPRNGTEFRVIGSVGIKSIKMNGDILSLKDNSFDYKSLYDSIKLKTYQLRIKGTAAHYFALGKQATLKTGINMGVLSSPNIFRNELFQIGGYRLLRGFDEESIFATQYGVGTVEYRFLSGLNSYFFAFADIGWVRNLYQGVDLSNQFVGVGAGLVFETKAGLLNLSYAFGKRNDITSNIRQASKIHFGFINYF